MPAARLGLHYYPSGIRRYVSRLGADNAKKLFLTAEKIGAPEMLRIGYLTAMVPADKLDEEVDRLATLLAANAPVAMAGMKRTINEIARGKLDEAAADARARDSMRGAEIKEGVRARAEKRPANFDYPSTLLTSPCGRGRIASPDAIRVRGYGPSIVEPPSPELLRNSTSPRRGEVNRVRCSINPTFSSTVDKGHGVRHLRA